MKWKAILIMPQLFGLWLLPAAAQSMNDMAPMDGRIAPQDLRGSGKIVGIDSKAGSINIAHEPIASLGWPKKTEYIELQDKALLGNLRVGQKISFRLIEVRIGKYAISEITLLK